MPYPNEHACRIESPSKFPKFRRKKGSGKTPDMIFGIKDGTSTLQAMRFPTSRFTKAEARAACKRAGGTFEAASGTSNEASQPIHNVCVVQNAAVRREKRDGRKYIVAPVVMLVEGVHCGSGGPLYYPAETLAQEPERWNGVPVTVHHPVDENGVPVSVNDNAAVNRVVIGEVANARWDAEAAKLRAELVIDESDARKVANGVVQALLSGTPLEISTGLVPELNVASGAWNDEQYEATATRLHPDHLAVLPGDKGACSWEDGCGVRANQRTERSDAMKGRVSAFFSALGSALGFRVHEVSHHDLHGKLREAIEDTDPDGVVWVRDVFDEDFVYEVQPWDADKGMPEGKPTLYRRGYTVGDDESVTLSDDAAEVREERTYVPVENIGNDQGGDSGTDADARREEDAMSDNATPAPQGDEQKNCGECPDAKQVETETQAAAAEPKVEDEPVADEPAANATPPKPVSEEEYINAAPPEIREVLVAGQDELRAKRARLIAEITANKRNRFTPETLKGMSLPMLRDVAALAKEQNYAGAEGGSGATANANAPAFVPAPPWLGVTANEKPAGQ